MNVTLARILMQALGTLAGVLGIGMLCVSLPMVYHAFSEWNPWAVALTAFSFVVAAYLVYVAYLVWFRFSPLAVRHVCGAVGFWVFILTAALFGSKRDSDAVWPAYVLLASLVLVLCAYRIASHHLSRLLFPVGSSRVQP